MKGSDNINVLGFSACVVPSCDCGARVVLGMSREDLRIVVGLLRRAGFVFHALSEAQAQRAHNVSFTASAKRDLEGYIAS